MKLGKEIMEFWTPTLLAAALFFSCNGRGGASENGKTTPKETAKTEQSVEKTKTKRTEAKQSAKTVSGKYIARVLNVYPHDRSSYTQGLLYKDGFIYESCGRYGSSAIKKIELETGKVVKKYDLPNRYFAEGIEFYDGKIYQLTWRAGVCFIYNEKTLEPLSQFEYRGEGWGVARVGDLLAISDGSDAVKFVQPKTFEKVRTILCSKKNQAVYYLNELENVKGKIWANVYQKDKIVVINPANGEIEAEIDLSPLYEYLAPEDNPDVLNGIAYDSKNDRIFVTGKLWKHLFEIELVRKY